MPRRAGWSTGLGATALAALLACGDRAPARPPYPAPRVRAEGDVVATVGTVKLTTAELEARMRAQTPFARVQLRDAEKRRRFAENEVDFELLAQEGWRQGLQDDPQVVAELKRLVVQRLVARELESAGPLDATDAELAEAYRAREAEFNRPERVRVSQIVLHVDDDAGRKAARRSLEGVKAAVLDAQKKNDPLAFGAAARERSEDEATRNGGGDVGFLSREELEGRYGAEVASHLFDRVAVGDLALADAANAVVLFKKTGVRRGTSQPLEAVRAQLRNQLLAEKRVKLHAALVERLRAANGVTIDEPMLERLTLPDDAAAPTALPPLEAPDGER
jgi:hypothetical protein